MATLIANLRKRLARRTTDHKIGPATGKSDFQLCRVAISAQICSVGCSGHWFHFESMCVETCALESKPQSAAARKEIEYDWRVRRGLGASKPVG